MTVDYGDGERHGDGGERLHGGDRHADVRAGDDEQDVHGADPGDTLDEPDETFVVNLSNATNATLGDGQGVGTITDDDAAPTLTISDVTVAEGNSGTTPRRSR